VQVTEFVPYVFQVLAQLLEFKVDDVGSSYGTLFAPLLTPALWESKGNIPALSRLLVAYVAKAGPKSTLIQPNLMGYLGVFQKLMASKANEGFGFQLISALVEHAEGYDAIKGFLKEVSERSGAGGAERGGVEEDETNNSHLLRSAQVNSILLTRLQKVKHTSYKRSLVMFFGLCCGKLGADKWSLHLNEVSDRAICARNGYIHN